MDLRDFDFEIEGDVIRVIDHDTDEETDYELNDFWRFVKKNGLNEWVNDFYDPRQHDGHGQSSGEYDLEEYLSQSYQSVKEDIHKYLNHKKK